VARAHGRILSTVWSDPDWVALSQGAQHLYMLLLSQSKLTLVGLLDYLPSRWARLAVDTSLTTVEANVAELEASRFVVVDRNTDELLIRTLVRHDITSLANGRANQKLVLGLWRAWQGIESRHLRCLAAHEIPDSLWDNTKCPPPPEALQMRRSAQIEPPTDPRIEPLSSLHSPLSTDAVADSQQPGNSRAPGQPAAAVDKSPADVFDQALDLLVAAELARNPTRGPSPRRHEEGVRRGKRRDHLAAARQHLAAHPDATPADLAALLEPPVPARGVRAASPLDGQQAAARARADRHLRAVAGEACQDCADTGIRLDEDGQAVPCNHQNTPPMTPTGGTP
jgi:hypothetical protein